MKACLQASARDAQLRDSFNKESTAAVNNDSAFTFCDMLYRLQCELPRNSSKLHSLVVRNSKDEVIFVLNFEVLRSVNLTDTFMGLEFPIDDLKSQIKKRNVKKTINSSDPEDNGQSIEKEEQDND